MSVLVPEEISLLVSSDPLAGATNINATGSQFTVLLEEGIKVPSDALNVNLRLEEATVWWVTPNISASLGNNKLYITEGATPYVITIPDGLYDVIDLNTAIARELETAGATVSPQPLIVISADDATQKVIMDFEYNNVSVDFTQTDTFREILGFDSQVLGPYPTAPISILADNTAAFNTIESFLFHTNLTQKGIRINNSYSQTLGQIIIDVPPGSQITSSPRHPARVSAQDLAGQIKTSLKFWLTDQENNLVDTVGEYFTGRIVIEWLQPFITTHSITGNPHDGTRPHPRNR